MRLHNLYNGNSYTDDHLIFFIIRIPILANQHLCIEMAPGHQQLSLILFRIKTKLPGDCKRITTNRSCHNKQVSIYWHLGKWIIQYIQDVISLVLTHYGLVMPSQLALRRWPNVGIGRHRRDRQPTSRQRWYSVACVATVCWHSVGARRLAYRSLPMFCVWTSVVGIKCFSNKCCRSTRLSIHQLHI